jgi:hypothetical protein
MSRRRGTYVSVNERNEELYSWQIPSHGIIGQLKEDHFKARDATRDAVLTYGDRLPYDVLEDHTHASATLRAAIGVSSIADSEARRNGRATIADFVLGGFAAFTGHCQPCLLPEMDGWRTASELGEYRRTLSAGRVLARIVRVRRLLAAPTSSQVANI